MKSINVPFFGETQREQWKGITYMLRRYGASMTQEGINGLCDELDRYIDHCEDIFDEMRKEEE